MEENVDVEKTEKIMENIVEKQSEDDTSASAIAFRPRIHKLITAEAKWEAIEIGLQFFTENGVPLSHSLTMARQFADENISAIVASIETRSPTVTGDSEILDGAEFTRAVFLSLRDFCRQWLTCDYQSPHKTQLSIPLPFCWSVSAVKNRRRTMEDRHLIDVSDTCLYCVFDGHGGVDAANYATTHFANHFVSSSYFAQRNITSAFVDSFLEIDKVLSEKCLRDRLRSGCTAVCACICGEKLYVAWAGDSQAGLIQKDKVKCLTPVHTPDDEDEYVRIEQAGGAVLCIQGELRVNGVLNLSRSLGDICAKPMVIADPSIYEQELTGQDVLLLLGCDGVWDSIDQEDCFAVLKQFVKEKSPEDYKQLAERFVLKAKENGSSDNMTAVVIFLRKPKDLWEIFI